MQAVISRKPPWLLRGQWAAQYSIEEAVPEAPATESEAPHQTLEKSYSEEERNSLRCAN